MPTRSRVSSPAAADGPVAADGPARRRRARLRLVALSFCVLLGMSTSGAPASDPSIGNAREAMALLRSGVKASLCRAARPLVPTCAAVGGVEAADRR